MLTVDTPLGRDAFGVAGFSGREEISSLFDFSLDLVARERPRDPVRADRRPAADGDAHAAGGDAALLQRGRLAPDAGRAAPARHAVPRRGRAVALAPDAERGLRIFQQKTVPDILRQVFSSTPDADVVRAHRHALRRATTASSTARPTSTSSSRLMEEEGIFYFFRHDRRRAHAGARRHAATRSRALGTFPFDRDRPTNRAPRDRLAEDAGAALGQGDALGLTSFELPHGAPRGQPRRSAESRAGRQVDAPAAARRQRAARALRLPGRLRPAVRRHRPGRRRPAGRPAEDLPRGTAGRRDPDAGGGGAEPRRDRRLDVPRRLTSGHTVHAARATSTPTARTC